jgi:DNA-binding NtrC family response regulator
MNGEGMLTKYAGPPQGERVMSKKPIVAVIDDREIVASLKTLLELEGEFEVAGFTDPAAAESFFAANPVDVVITDHRLAGVNGLDLLKRLKAVRPEASRILLTSHVDAASAIQAINEVALFQYLEKPWDNEQLLLATRSGVERATLLRGLGEKVEQLDSAHSTLKDTQRRLIHAFL